jgi:hypothetical protein
VSLHGGQDLYGAGFQRCRTGSGSVDLWNAGDACNGCVSYLCFGGHADQIIVKRPSDRTRE